MADQVVRILIDDVRSFKDGRPCVIARTAESGLAVLHDHRPGRIDELWLDHDLGRQRNAPDLNVMAVVEHLVEASLDDAPYDIGVIWIHSSNVRAAVRMRQLLAAAGYNARSRASVIWRHDQSHVSGPVGTFDGL